MCLIEHVFTSAEGGETMWRGAGICRLSLARDPWLGSTFLSSSSLLPPLSASNRKLKSWQRQLGEALPVSTDAAFGVPRFKGDYL